MLRVLINRMCIPIVLALLAFAPGISAQNGLPGDIQQFIVGENKDLTETYKHLHRHPEVSLHEEQTAKFLATKLSALGYEVTEGVGGHSVVAMLKNGDGPVILYRTDLDALPVTEKTGLDYASTVVTEFDGVRSGVMHACGHDVHMAAWLGVAKTMMQFRDRWSGTLMMIGQPAEEIGLGAKKMLEDGLYERFAVPDFGIAFHTSATLPAGHIGIDAGYTMAHAESIDIRVFGISAHGAQPHLAIDPVVLASQIVQSLQTITSRNLKPTDAAVITVGAIQGGVKNNIIPDEVVLKLTVRTFTEEVRLMVHRRIREICHGLAIAAGLPEDKYPEIIALNFTAPANYNDPALAERLRSSAVQVVGEAHVHSVEPQTVAEDFALYGRTEHGVPTVLFWLGTVPDARIRSGDMPGLHTPRYYPDPETSLLTGVQVVTQMLLDLYNS